MTREYIFNERTFYNLKKIIFINILITQCTNEYLNIILSKFHDFKGKVNNQITLFNKWNVVIK